MPVVAVKLLFRAKSKTKADKFMRRFLTTAVLALQVFLLSGAFTAQAADGIWTLNGDSTWSTTTSWFGGTVADGSGFTADFSTININQNRTVTLNTSLTIGSLVFGDTKSHALRTWTLDNSGASVLTLAGGATPAITLSATGPGVAVNISAPLAGNQGFTYSGTVGAGAGSGVLSLSGAAANTYSGTATVNSGALVLGKTAGVNAITGNLVIGDGTGTDTVQLNAANQIADIAAVTINSSGVLNLNGNAETIGSLSGSSGASIALGAGTLSVGDATSTAYAGTITGTGGLTKSGAGTLALSGANSYSGATTINAGSLVVGANAPNAANGALGNASSAVLVGNTSGSADASLLTGGAFNIGRAVTVRSGNSGVMTLGGSTDNNSTFAGAITLQKSATFAQVATTTGRTLTLSGGITTATAGAKTATFNNAGDVTVSTVGITQSGGGTIAVIKQGAGTLNLNVASTYTGGTTLTAGTLRLGANNVVPDTGTFTFAGGVLDANNRNETFGALSLTADSTLNLVAGTASTLTFNSTSGTAIGMLTINNWSGSQGGVATDDRIFFSGTVPNAAFLSHIRFDLGGTLYYAEMGIDPTELVAGVTPVPEPTEWALLIFAVLAVFYKFVWPRLRALRNPDLARCPS